MRKIYQNSRKKLRMFYGLLACLSVVQFTVLAQNKTVKGVVSAGGDVLPGVSVTIKGTNRGTITNEKGAFSIEASATENLVISMVGFVRREVAVGNQAQLNITLAEDEKALDEVVVVGYGTQRKRDITGAIASISPGALKEVPTANVINSLKGRLAGVDIQSNSTAPGAGAQIRIRGNRQMATSAGASDQVDAPLLVVDGVQFSGSINDLNPETIASIDILKDASAKAIYGSRGAGGVILITTKRGRAGKPQFNYSGNYGVVNPIGRFEPMNATEYIAYKADAAAGNTANAGVNSYSLTPLEEAGKAKGVNTDWQSLIFSPGYVNEHNINVNGGTESTKYLLSGGYYKETANTVGQDYTRYNVQLAIDQKVGKRVNIGFSTMNTVGDRNGYPNPVGTALRLSPLIEPYNADGTINLYPWAGGLDAPNTVNPLQMNGMPENIANLRRNIRTFNTIYADLKILEGLKYTIRANANLGFEKFGSYEGPMSFANPSTALSQARAQVQNTTTSTLNLQNQLDYVKAIGKHTVTATAMYEVQKDSREFSGFNGTGMPADYNQYFNLNLAGTVTAQGGQFSEAGLVGMMGRLTYSYGDKYALTATYRRDGSSVLSPGYQYVNYPAISAAWSISEEGFLKGVSAISNLKLRAGWGISANGGINAYTTLGTLGTNFYNFGQDAAGQNIGYIVNVLANKKLTWASTSEQNIGLDFGLFNSRINGSVEVYKQNTKDILLNQSLPASNGATSTTVNAGKTKGHGLELSLSSTNIITPGGFTWSTDFNYSFNREEIVELQNPAAIDDKANGWFVGQPLNVIYDGKKLGIWQTNEAEEAKKYGRLPGQIKIADLNNDGKLDANDRTIVGNFQPKWVGGITNRFSYKNVDLSFVIHARMGQTVVAPYFMADGGAQGYPFFNNSRVNSLQRDYWTPTNPTNEFPRPDAGQDGFQYSSTLGYKDGSFIRMRSIDAAYRLPNELISKSGFSNVKIFVNVTNPFLIYAPFVDKGYGFDPEGNGYGGVSSSLLGGTPVPGRAITVNLNNPTTRMMRVGLNFTF
jgi:TonB-dependent starch-binding outer membrane protein SusC